MSTSTPFVLRPAQPQDKWAIQRMLWQFTWDEGIELDIRLFGYAFFRLGLVGLALWLQFQWRQSTTMVDVEFILVVTSVATVGLGFYLASLVTGQLMMRFCGALINWSRFRVIEKDEALVGCALLNSYTNHSELAYVFVQSQFRHQGWGSQIVQTLIQESSEDVYLACKPQVVPFYQQLGFSIQPWADLPAGVKRCFRVFRPHPRLWKFKLNFMRCPVAPVTPSEATHLSESAPRS
ncbi:GNAT family N-acetyltransferase [Acaryochloris sp. IP29b_bin.137]|uniref:GNAT family N-acetyltransferase n=1 Tax=Acaryochloris sp. IP29b_bin.137 TaxID=2969217 RepID=UPI002631D811|nr:GNAT family N-acetyltransferase [Acaryochloris sp. IP29b_bin.137]